MGRKTWFENGKFSYALLGLLLVGKWEGILLVYWNWDWNWNWSRSKLGWYGKGGISCGYLYGSAFWRFLFFNN